MQLKNYTSCAPAHATISYIEAYLIECGAQGIAKEIKGGVVQSIIFQITADGRSHTIKLPANVAGVLDFMWQDYVTSHVRPKKSKDDFKEQANRTAWKIMQDWVQVQMSLIKLKQADFLQVFLAFTYDGNQTYYEYLKEGKFKALPAPKN